MAIVLNRDLTQENIHMENKYVRSALNVLFLGIFKISQIPQHTHENG